MQGTPAVQEPYPSASDSTLEPLLTARQVAGLLSMSADTVLDRFEAGDLPGFKLWRGTDSLGRAKGAVRFKLSELTSWIDSQRATA